MPEQAECSSCGRAIIWTVSPTGARLPLDARPASVYSIATGQLDQVLAVKHEPLEAGGAFYVSHFLTCPSANQHSRKGRA